MRLSATLAVPAAVENAKLNIQVHGGIGFTWEHDAHLYFRRALAIEAILGRSEPARDVTELLRCGVTLTRAVELPPEAESFRAAARTAHASHHARGIDATAEKRA